MQKIVVMSLLIVGLVLAACSSTKETPGVWINKEKMQGKSFSNIFIIVMTADIVARTTLENDLAAEATARGNKVIKSIDVMPPSPSDPKTPTKDEVVSHVKASGCDGVFVASLLRKEEDVRYTPGSTAYSVGPTYSWQGTYSGYYTRWYPTVSTSDYYSQDKNYFMQSNLYDAASEEVMWTVQSEIFSPSSLKSFSKSYTSTLIKQLGKAGLLKK